MLILLAVNVLLLVIALAIQQRTIWLLHQRVAQLEKHRLEIIREYTFTVEDDQIAAMNQRIFDRLFGEDDEDAPPVTRH